MTDESLPVAAKIVISINKARELGLTRYFTGKPCKRGHISERFTRDRHCVRCGYIKSKRERLEDPHKHKEYMKLYRKQWVEINPTYFRNWVDQNRESTKIHQQRCRTRRLSVEGRLSTGLPSKLLNLQRGKCACCKKDITKGYHLDHIYALARGGANEDLNIQLLCPRCNLSKHAKHPIDFMQERGFLL